MLERNFTIVCDRGCDLPPVYLERAQATVLEDVPHDALGHVDEVALTQALVRTYRALAAQGHDKIVSVHSCASFSPVVTCAREAAAACEGVADVRVIDAGSASAATGMVIFRLMCHWADGATLDEAVEQAQRLAGSVRLLVIPTVAARFARRRSRKPRAGLLGRATSSLRIRISGERGLYLVSRGEVTQLARSSELSDLTGRLAHAMSAVAASEGELVYATIETGDARALRALEKPLDTNEFEARRLGSVSASSQVEKVVGQGAVAVAFAPADVYWRAAGTAGEDEVQAADDALRAGRDS